MDHLEKVPLRPVAILRSHSEPHKRTLRRDPLSEISAVPNFKPLLAKGISTPKFAVGPVVALPVNVLWPLLLSGVSCPLLASTSMCFALLAAIISGLVLHSRAPLENHFGRGFRLTPLTE